MLVTPTETIQLIREDPDDNKFIECVLAGGAEDIVSGDTYLLAVKEYRGIHILSPSLFLAVLKAQPAYKKAA
jgi:uncharacterized protein